MQTLTKKQHQQWQTDGFLHLKQVITTEEAEFYKNEIDRIRQIPGYEPANNPDLPRGHYAWMDHAPDRDSEGFMDRRDLLTYGQHFIDLIDRSPIFDYIVDLMGPNILLSMTQAIVRPTSDEFGGYTHTDGGESLRRIRVAENCPPIAMKAMYLLSDVTEKDSSNLTVFPGSHKRQIPDEGQISPYAPGAKQLMGKAGDVYLFPHALWHGPAKNHSGRSRKILLYNYCQLWVRCYDFHGSPDIPPHCTLRQRRLLGDLDYDFRPGSYFYVPKDQADVILS